MVPKSCSLTSTNSKTSLHRKDSLQYNMQAAPASQGPASVSLKTNLLLWVRKSRWIARPILTPSPLQKCVRDPFTAPRSAHNSIDLGSAIGKEILERDCRACHKYCQTIFGRLWHALGAPFSPKTKELLLFFTQCLLPRIAVFVKDKTRFDNASCISHASLSWSALNVLALRHRTLVLNVC